MDLTCPLRGKLKTGLPESIIISRLGGSLGEIRDTWGSREEMACIVSESWLEWRLGTEDGATPRRPEIGMLPSFDVETTTRVETKQLRNLVNRVLHAALPRHVHLNRTMRDKTLSQGPSPESLRGGSCRPPSGAANGPPSSNSRVGARGHGRKRLGY